MSLCVCVCESVCEELTHHDLDQFPENVLQQFSLNKKHEGHAHPTQNILNMLLSTSERMATKSTTHPWHAES